MMNTTMRTTAFSLAGIAAAFWLLQRSKRLHEFIELSPKWRNDDGRSCSLSELDLDDTIAASFPASDPSSSTPIIGTGHRTSTYPFAK